jgi:DNA-binding transcriptional LysR family regulator
VLTEAGGAYGAHLSRWLGEDDTLRGQLGEVRQARRGTLRVTVPVFVAEQVLPRALEALQREHPEVLVDVHASDDVMDLVQGGFDLALRLGPLRDSSLEARRLVSFRRVVCAAPSLLARLGTPSHPSALAALPCLHYGSGPSAPMWKLVHHSGEAVKVAIDCRLRSNNLAMLEAMASAGAGFVRLPDWTADEALRAGRLVRVLDAWSADDPRRVPTLYAVHPRDAGKAALRAVFLSALERAVGATERGDKPRSAGP